ncbi:hypothetical protein DFQ04_0299 [Algoriphagus boseongensis]|uniref:Uncharacterized protein n=1 Tax=Algoriphagus boseongensis TaxID=1442587 RepID=A0A4V3D2D4_9BACT|nr:hypothetical protein [Algoriphagus boseongensis]TDQ18497.1 hypothetical protein DFQ04_0299 [Algoriphagus boseongensis]
MKLTTLLFSLLLIPGSYFPRLQVVIPVGESVQLTWDNSATSKVKIFNTSSQGIDVKVVHAETKEFIRGFGLSKNSTEEVLVEEFASLLLSNPSKEAIKVGYLVSLKAEESQVFGKEVGLTFYNSSKSSIPLIIPGVMNPNLNPMSTSGVALKIGQEVFFKVNGKKYLLLKIDNTYQDGQVLDIPTLIKVRKKEFGI